MIKPASHSDRRIEARDIDARVKLQSTEHSVHDGVAIRVVLQPLKRNLAHVGDPYRLHAILPNGRLDTLQTRIPPGRTPKLRPHRSG